MRAVHSPTVTVQWLGEERLPIVVIDDLAPRPEDLVGLAADLPFAVVDGQNYPGVRAPAPPAYAAQTADFIIEITARYFQGKMKPQILRTYYSLVTTAPNELTPTQRLPHFDSVYDNRPAFVHYLCPPSTGGTSFYRHRATGYESVNARRLSHYSDTLEQELAREGAPPPGFANGDSPLFEHLLTVDAVYNRGVLFFGHALHSGSPPNDRTLSADIKDGRLTVVNFLAI